MNPIPAFSLDEAIHFVKRQTQIFPPDSELDAEMLRHNRFQIEFRIKNKKKGKSVILKQYVQSEPDDYLKWPLPHERLHHGMDASRIIQQAVPEMIPSILVTDPEKGITVHEDAAKLTDLQTALFSDRNISSCIQPISEFLAKNLFFTSIHYKGTNMQRVDESRNVRTRQIIDQLLFHLPYSDERIFTADPDCSQMWKEVHSSIALNSAVVSLREKYLSHAQCFLHGQLTSENILFSAQQLKIISFDYAFLGPAGFDPGTLFSSLLIAAAIKKHQYADDEEQRTEQVERIFATIIEVWIYFEQQFRMLWNMENSLHFKNTPGYQNDFMQRMLSDSAGFTGCQIMRAIYSISAYPDLVDESLVTAVTKTRIDLIKLASQLILTHQNTKSIADLIQISRFCMR